MKYLVLVAASLSLHAIPAPAADMSDPHDHVILNPPAAATIAAAASKVSFSTANSIEEAGADAIEYFDAISPTPKLNERRLAIIGRIVVKVPGIYFKDSRDKLPQGRYFHWMGKVDGAWATGFAAADGSRNVLADLRFAVMSDRPHKHLQVYTHSPEGAKAWSDYVLRKAALPGTPTVPLPPPSIPKPPDLPSTPEPAPEPPKPPSEWRCVEVWKWVDAPDGTKLCSIIGWARVPAN
jgi:hypothetical protein